MDYFGTGAARTADATPRGNTAASLSAYMEYSKDKPWFKSDLGHGATFMSWLLSQEGAASNLTEDVGAPAAVGGGSPPPGAPLPSDPPPSAPKQKKGQGKAFTIQLSCSYCASDAIRPCLCTSFRN